MRGITVRILTAATSAALFACAWCGVTFANENVVSFDGDPVALDSPDGLAVQSLEGLSAQAGSSSSGLDNVEKPTMQELRSLYKELPAHPSVSNGYWSVAPDVNAYKAGTLSSESIAFAQAYLNLIRRSANLDDVAFESTLNANASQGALILARLDSGLTHYPSTPSGVTDAQAAPGKYACSSSNLSYSWGYGNPLQIALQGQMDDEDSSNMSRVGHRRWLLHPATRTMGIGSARSESGAMFTDVRVFDQSGGDASYGYVSRDNSVSYDYVAWPASGAFLNDLFAPGTPWSVSLNTDRYDLPNASSVKVRVKRLSDGRTWNLDNADSAVTTTGEYFAVENSGYGTPGCIIFNPGSANIGTNEYAGSYAVEITGLKTSGGADTSISYQVDFDSAQIDLNRSGATISSIPNATYTGSEIKPAVDVTCDGKGLVVGRDYELSYSNNVDAGKASVTVTGVGAYKGEIAKSFTITPRDLSGAEVSVASQQTYTGRTVEPAPTVRLGNLELNRGSDYVVSYSNNVNVGTARVIVSGTGNYSGSATGSFEIVDAPSSGGGNDSTPTPRPTPSNPTPSNPTPAPQPAPARVEMYRLYNPYTGEHFYTADAGERDSLSSIGWTFEGVGWVAPRDGEPVYRLYNPFAGDHHYTTSAGERDGLVAAGWVDEGVGWRSAGEGGTPLYRQYNPYATVGTHNYTTSKDENDMLVSVGWVEEGVGWYGVA